MAHPGGRPLKIATPEDLWTLFEEYQTWANNNPWNKKEAIKSGERAGTIIDLPTDRPLTEWEFATFCNMSRSGLIEYSKREQFSDIYSRIKDEMSAQRISGGIAGAYNGNLVARIDGIVEKSEIDNTHRYPDGIEINFTNKTDDE